MSLEFELRRHADLERLAENIDRTGLTGEATRQHEAEALQLCGYDARAKALKIIREGLKKELQSSRERMAKRLQEATHDHR